MNPSLHRWSERIRRGEPIPMAAAAVLAAFTPVVRLGMWMRKRQPTVRVDARVISFGNITAGGTGKTPAVIERAIQEIAAGRKVAVLTRGYGAKQSREPIVFDGAREAGVAYEILGDEPALIVHKVLGVVVVKCADRVAGARSAIERCGCDTLILDDGYQQMRLERDENVLVIDAANPFGNGHLIPRGILREPIEAMRRATFILLTRCDQAASLEPLLETVRAMCPDAPIRRTRHTPKRLWRVADGMSAPLEELAGEPVKAVCAIARPEAFFATLENLGAVVTERIALPDHGAIPLEALAGPRPVIMTEKDAMRLVTSSNHVWALSIELEDMEES